MVFKTTLGEFFAAYIVCGTCPDRELCRTGMEKGVDCGSCPSDEIEAGRIVRKFKAAAIERHKAERIEA